MFRVKVPLLTIFLCLMVFPNLLLAQPTVLFDPDLTERQRATATGVLEDVLSSYERRIGYKFKPSTTIIFSDRPEFLAKEHAKRNNSPYEQKLKAFQSWINAEAGYERIYVNMSSQSWRKARDRKPLMAHELFHILQHDLVGSRSRYCCKADRVSSLGPTWLHEGSANYFERIVNRRSIRDYMRHSRKQLRHLSGNSLSVLETRNGTNRIENSYDIGAFAVGKLVDENGPRSVITFYRGLGQGKSWQNAFESAFGKSPQAFYADFN